MSELLTCRRCGREQPPMPAPPLPGATGTEILASTCGDCWQEWEKMEVMVINELRLNFMEPSAQETLTRQMREFLGLSEAVDS